MATGRDSCRTSGGTKDDERADRMTRLAILAAVLAALSGCNTIAGAGEDITGGANTIQGWMGGRPGY